MLQTGSGPSWWYNLYQVLCLFWTGGRHLGLPQGKSCFSPVLCCTSYVAMLPVPSFFSPFRCSKKYLSTFLPEGKLYYRLAHRKTFRHGISAFSEACRGTYPIHQLGSNPVDERYNSDATRIFSARSFFRLLNIIRDSVTVQAGFIAGMINMATNGKLVVDHHPSVISTSIDSP